MPGGPVRVYATCPPEWWPFWLARPRGGCTPRGRVESIILDNGAYSYAGTGGYPELHKWQAQLARRARQLRTLAEELYIVLPDYVGDPRRTLEAARRSRWLCRSHRCILVMQYTRETLTDRLFEEYTSLDVDLYALPLKLNSMTRYSGRARKALVDWRLQLRALALAHHHAPRLHLLAPSAQLLRRLWAFPRVESIDTTSWTRPVTARLKHLLGTISARNTAERELLFAEYLDWLARTTGRPIDRWHPATATTPA